MNRTKIYDAITSEREYQERKWGPIEQHSHEVGAYLTLMDVHFQRAKAAWAGTDGDRSALNELRKILALGVACAEEHGIEGRSPTQPVSQKMRDNGHQRTERSR